MTKIVSQLNAAGYYVGDAFADEDQQLPGEFLLPFGCVDSPPPEVPVGQRARFVAGAFVFEDIPPPPPPPVVPSPTQAQIIAALSAQIQKRLDDFAATRRYTNVDSLEKYKGLTDAQIATLPAELQTIVLRFRAECDYLVLKTAETWAVSELIETRVKAGNWPTNGAGQQPTDISDFEAELPVLAWPV